MGIEPFMVAHVLIGAIAQRLLRRVCPDCAIPYSPTTAELAQFGLSAPIDEITIYKANTRKERLAKKALGNVCHNCYGMGYKGFVGVYQVMPVTSRIKTLINKMVNTDMICQVAEAKGMKSFFDYSLDLVRQKHTTLEEINRLIQNNYSFAS
jgi:type IV pilus assembly protein PilB